MMMNRSSSRSFVSSFPRFTKKWSKFNFQKLRRRGSPKLDRVALIVVMTKNQYYDDDNEPYTLRAAFVEENEVVSSIHVTLTQQQHCLIIKAENTGKIVTLYRSRHGLSGSKPHGAAIARVVQMMKSEQRWNIISKMTDYSLHVLTRYRRRFG
jgi:hypothetical protein